MTDKKFKWLVSAAALTIIIVAAIWKAPEMMKAQSMEREPELGEYVYIDGFDKVHAKRKCPKLNYKGLRSSRVPVADFDMQYDQDFCPYCVSDKAYKQLADGKSAHRRSNLTESF